MDGRHLSRPSEPADTSSGQDCRAILRALLREADDQLDYLRGLRIRLLGDRVLQRYAWNIASKLEWTNTYCAEYIAVAQLQADALVTLDPDLAAAAQSFVRVASVEDLLATIA